MDFFFIFSSHISELFDNSDVFLEYKSRVRNPPKTFILFFFHFDFSACFWLFWQFQVFEEHSDFFFPQNYVFWKFWPILGIVTNWILSFFKDFYFFFSEMFFSFFLQISLFVGFWLFFNFDIFWNFDLFSKSWSCWELKFFFLLDFWLSFS